MKATTVKVVVSLALTCGLLFGGVLSGHSWGRMSDAVSAGVVGGVADMICPANANATCGQHPCTYYSGYVRCEELSGGSYKVCETTETELSCSNTGVTCGTRSWCSKGSEDCGESNPVCSCNTEYVYKAGCL